MDKFLIPFGLCQTFEGAPSTFMMLHLPNTHMASHNLFISDPAAAAAFQLPYSLLSGDKILVKQSNTGTWSDYKIKITENTVETNDGTCVDYPNDGHESYSDCIDAELRGKIVPVLGCMVPWMSGGIACSQPVPRLAKHEALLQWISNISLASWGDIEFRSDACLPPCRTLSFHVSKAPSDSSRPKGDSAVCLYFQETIDMRAIVLAYDATSLLVEVGSCLGLWLGLSVVGIFDACTVIMAKIKRVATRSLK